MKSQIEDKQKDKIGFLICSYNDLDLSEKMYPSLIQSINGDTNYMLVVVDAGSTDGTVEFWKSKCEVLQEKNKEQITEKYSKIKDCEFFHLSVALNAGIEYLISNGCTHVTHIHPDMLFPEKGWVEEVVKFVNNNPKAGKTASEDVNIRQPTRGPANQCPWTMSKACIEKHISVDGHVFDPRFIGIGGMEDHYLCRRQLMIGYCPMICGTSLVNHNDGQGMGTRSRRDTNREAFYNRNLYARDFPGVCLHNWKEKLYDWWSEVEWI
jgi:GT2 family glycosyltransferase